MVYSIAPSSLNGDLLWAGSNSGLIHITRDGGKTWKDVTPKGVTDWSNIAFLEASHFDPAEAYAAVDRHRLDDQQPYLYRTRDYGASWQLITNGMAAPSFLRAVRQDPQDKNLLFAGTEFGIYVSFDDGDHWQSLQMNLPVTSVHDLVVHGDDLVIATHGRSFWVLDDITALRQVSKAGQAAEAWFYAPATAVRVENDSFLGTPVPPEEPAAQNPPKGAIVDYYLKSAATQIKLEIFDLKGHLIRGFSSGDAREVKHLPFAIADRWFPKPQVLDRTPGMHRFVWDLAWGRTSAKTEDGDDDEEYGAPRGPLVVPGTYELKLTVDGKTSTQKLNVVMDPRLAVTAAELDQQYSLGQKMFAEATRSRQALAEIRAVQAQIAAVQGKLGDQQAELKASVRSVQEEIKKLLSGSARSGEGMGLEIASGGIGGALRMVESGHRAVPSQAIAVFEESDRAAKLRIEEWTRMKTTRLRQLNDQLKRANADTVSIGEIEHEIEYLMTR